jgi:flagellar hook-associated protein 2
MASSYTASFVDSTFNFASANTIYLKATDGSLQTLNLGGSNISSLTALRDAINANSATSNIRAAVVAVSNNVSSLVLTSTTGGAANRVALSSSLNVSGNPTELAPDAGGAITGNIVPTSKQGGADAVFTINGQSFTRSTNTVMNAIPGVTLQLQSNSGTSTITVTADNTSSAKTLLSNVGQAYNDLMSSFTELTKFDSDPTKRGSLYDDSALRSMMDSISLSFTTSLTRSGTTLKDAKNKPISLTSLGLEMQLDGTIKFNAAVYDAAVSAEAFVEVSQGTASPTRTIVNSAMSYQVGLDADITAYTKQNDVLTSRVKDLETRKAEKMAKYRAQYAALDALLYKLQSMNTSLSATFNALNNQKNN